MSTSVLFLTEAGEGIGFGHLNRSIALADGFETFNCEVSFTVRGVENPVIQNRTFTEVNEEWFNKEYLEEAIPNFDVVVTDSYQVSENLLNYISEESKTTVFLIDSQLRHGNRGIILFPSVYAKEYTFHSHNYLKILSGIKYLLYTKEMWNGLRFEVKKNVKSVGISLGSSSINLTGLRPELLKDIFPELTQICVFGNLKIEDYSGRGKVQINKIGRLNKEKYIAKLQNLDFLISNGGQTLNEALLIGLPVLPLITADNQLRNVKAWTKKNFVNGLDARATLDSDEFSTRLRAFEDYNTRKQFYEKCRNTVDPKGAIRSAKEILKAGTN